MSVAGSQDMVFRARRYLTVPLAGLAVLIVLSVCGIVFHRAGLVAIGVMVLVLTSLGFLPIALVAHVRIAGNALTSSSGAVLRPDPGGPVQLDQLTSVVSVTHGRYRPLYRTSGLLPTFLIELTDAMGGAAVVRAFGLSDAALLRSVLRQAALTSNAQLDVNTRRYLDIQPITPSPVPGRRIERRYYIKVGNKTWRVK